MVAKLVALVSAAIITLARTDDVIKAYTDVDYQASGAQFLRWHVEVYKYTDSGLPDQTCSGSLVAPTVVISAARCFWGKGEQLPASRFVVARTYEGFDRETPWLTLSKVEVRTIHLPPSFRDRAGLYQDDIAVLTLASPLRGVVTPICVSFDDELERRQLAEGKFGRNMGTVQLAGYALPSPLFTALELPYVAKERCLNDSEPYYQEQLTPDKICTGFKPGSLGKPESLICRGDQGSGLAFYRGSSHHAVPYLRGVASTPFPDPTGPTGPYGICSTFRYAAFTRISTQRVFLERLIPGLEATCAQYYESASAGADFECNCYCNKTVS